MYIEQLFNLLFTIFCFKQKKYLFACFKVKFFGLNPVNLQWRFSMFSVNLFELLCYKFTPGEIEVILK